MAERRTRSQCGAAAGRAAAGADGCRDSEGSLEASPVLGSKDERRSEDLTEAEIRRPACVLLSAPRGSIAHRETGQEAAGHSACSQTQSPGPT